MGVETPTAVPPPTARLWSTSTIIKNVTSNWASIIVGALIAFVLAPVTVRALGNVYYGVWTLLMQLTGYLWLFDFGVRESVVKYVAQYESADDREQIQATVATAVSIYGIVSLITLALTIALAAALPYVFTIPPDAVATARITTLFVGGTVAQYFVFNVFVGVLMGLQRVYIIARLGMLFTIVRGLIIYVMLTAGYGIVTLSVVQFSLALVNNLIIVRICVRLLPYLSIRPAWPRRSEALKLFHYGKYVLISNVGDKIIFATDSIIIGAFLPISALTYYAVGGSLIEQFRAFITSMSSLVNPMSSRLQARSEEGAVALLVQTGVRAAIIIGLPVAIGFVLLGDRFIAIWMGPEYAGPSGRVLAVLAVGHLLGLPYYTISAALYGLGRHRVVAQSRIFEGIVNLALSVTLVRSFGIVGVALGTVIPHVIVVVAILPRVLARWVPLDLRRYYVATYARPLLSGVPFALVCWYIASTIVPANFPSFFASVAVALTAYVVPAWFIGLTSDERARLSAAVRRRIRGARPVAGLA